MIKRGYGVLLQLRTFGGGEKPSIYSMSYDANVSSSQSRLVGTKALAVKVRHLVFINVNCFVTRR